MDSKIIAQRPDNHNEKGGGKPVVGADPEITTGIVAESQGIIGKQAVARGVVPEGKHLGVNQRALQGQRQQHCSNDGFNHSDDSSSTTRR